MCGMTRKEDVTHAVNLGVDAIGLIFYHGSSRNITIEQAQGLLINWSPFVDVVAVLVNPEQQFVQQLIKELPISVLQFHGDETAEFCQQFDKPFIKTLHPHSSTQIMQFNDEFNTASAILLDSVSGQHRGGTGQTFDWRLIPAHSSMPYILAGGLNELNIKEAIKASNPYAVDVCSGIESSPGIKDHQKMNRFIEALWGMK